MKLARPLYSTLAVAGVVAVIIASIVAGGGALTLVLVALAGAALVALSRWRPMLAAIVWVVVAVTVPPWIYPSLVGYRIAPLALASAAVIVGRALVERLRWTVADSLVAALAAAAVMAAVVFDSPLHVAAQVIGEWVLCYAAGRYLARDSALPRVLGLAGAVLGAGAVLQMALNFNVVDLPPFGAVTGEAFWSTLQYRAGLTRSELFVGHSIALGGILALCLPFALRLQGRIVPWVSAGLIVAGVLATVSRAALLAVVTVLALEFVTTTRLSTRLKWRVGIPTAVATVVAGVIYWLVLSGKSESELVDGTDYRYGLVDLFAKIRPFGVGADAVAVPGSETFQWGRYVSIDNAFLYIGLYIGAVALAAYIAVLGWVVWRTVRQGWGAASIALVAQAWLILTVAPITQYQSVMWLVTGLAATAIAGDGGRPDEGEPDERG